MTRGSFHSKLVQRVSAEAARLRTGFMLRGLCCAGGRAIGCRRRALATLAHEIRQHPPTVLTESQREHYLEHGFLLLPGFLPEPWLERLELATAEAVEKARHVTHEDVRPLGDALDAEQEARHLDKYMLAEGHTAANPMLTRLSAPVDYDETFWAFASGFAADIASDLLGPNVRFHHSKLNFKWPGALERIHWHQDIQFWPHTNYTPLSA